MSCILMLFEQGVAGIVIGVLLLFMGVVTVSGALTLTGIVVKHIIRMIRG